MLIYNPYAPLNHTFHFIHQMLMVLQTPTLPSRVSLRHQKLSQRLGTAGNWQVGTTHSGVVGLSHFLFWGGPCRTTCGILVPQPGIEPTALRWKLGVLTTGLPGKSPSPLSLGAVVLVERTGCEHLGKDCLGRSG